MADILIGTATTNASGVAVFSTLPPGNYKYVQTSAKTGYTPDSTSYNVTVNSATPVEADRANSPAEVGSMTITKHVEGNPALVLAGATFKLMDSAGKTMKSVSAPSGANGQIVFNNLMSITGTPQSYEVQEVAPPANYNLNTTLFTDSVTVGAITPRPVPNTPTVQGSLDITLTDTNYDEYGIQGTEYTLYWVDGN